MELFLPLQRSWAYLLLPLAKHLSAVSQVTVLYNSLCSWHKNPAL
ncbi:hypothetical protein [Hymenobacter daeguensis]